MGKADPYSKVYLFLPNHNFKNSDIHWASQRPFTISLSYLGLDEPISGFKKNKVRLILKSE